VIENHNGDSLVNDYSNARNSYNQISAYPTTKFDGVLSHVGGNGSSSLYNTFLPFVNQRNGVMSSFTIDLEFENTGGNNYDATATIEKVADYSGTNLVLQLVVTESNLDIVWGLGTQVHSVNRLMVPNQNGTPLNFSSGNTQVVDLSFTMASHWVPENCELIAFVQNNSNKEVVQATLKTMAVPQYTNDVELVSVDNIPERLCYGEIEPQVKIRNKGAEVLTNVDINFEINGELVYTHPWSGELEFPLAETIDIPVISFTALQENTVHVYISEPNGVPDQNPENDDKTINLEPTYLGNDFLALVLKLDASPAQITWECYDPDGELAKSGGPYTQAFALIKDTIFYEKNGCYQFFINDAAGNGLTTYYSLRTLVDGEVVIIHNGGSFEYSEETQVTALEGVMAAFAGDVEQGCEELTVNFTDASLGEITEWSWEFEGGDPATSTEQNPTVFYAIPGSYDVSLSVSDGNNSNTTTYENYINVFNLPEVDFAGIDDQCINHPAFELTQGTPEGGVYSGPGVDNGWFDPAVAGVGTHTLTYDYTDENGCENVATTEVYVDACTGIETPGAKQNIRVFPNPVTGNSSIEVFVSDGQNAKVEIFNSLGMLVKAFDLSNASGLQNIQVLGNEFENGVYFISFYDGSDVITTKMTIVR
jgi:PKD repeat protein